MIEKLKAKLAKIEKELDKCRGTVLEDGWQTMRYAKKMRKWDYFGQEKMKLLEQIEDYAIETRKKCPVKLICQCPLDKDWDGICKLNK